jgi:hypothetical protein
LGSCYPTLPQKKAEGWGTQLYWLVKGGAPGYRGAHSFFGWLRVAYPTEDKRRYSGQVQVATCGDIGCKYGLGDSGRRQISARRLCGIHDQVHVFAHQP